MYKSICKLKTSGKMENEACYDSKNVKLTKYQKYQVFTIMLFWDPKLYYMGKTIYL